MAPPWWWNHTVWDRCANNCQLGRKIASFEQEISRPCLLLSFSTVLIFLADIRAVERCHIRHCLQTYCTNLHLCRSIKWRTWVCLYFFSQAEWLLLLYQNNKNTCEYIWIMLLIKIPCSVGSPQFMSPDEIVIFIWFLNHHHKSTMKAEFI